MADAGVAARRECEELVLAGAVTVNGKIVDRLPAWVDPAVDKIEVYGRPLRRAEKHVYIMLFKPRGTVCTNSDPEGRPRAIDLVQHPSRPRLYCVGRLDLDSSGLLILTNDGDFANRLTHPRYLVEKGYDITVDGSLDERAISELERSIFAAEKGRNSAPTRSSLRLISRDRDKTVMHLSLCEHRNLQIRPLMLELGHPVNKLRRTSFGPLRLKGLAVGEWRELASREVDQLMRASKAEDPSARRAPRAPKRSMVELATAREERAQRLSAAGDAPAAAARPAERALGKPLGKPLAKPLGKPTGKPIETRSGKPGGKPTERPGGKPFGKPGGKPFGKPGGKPSGKPGGKPSGKPGGKRAEHPGAKPAGTPKAKPSRTPAPFGGRDQKSRRPDARGRGPIARNQRERRPR